MRVSRRRVLLAALVLAAGAVSGCAVVSTGEGAASWVQNWDSFDDVWADATVVVVGVAEGKKQIPSVAEGSGPKDTTLTTFQVSQSYGTDADAVEVRSTAGLDAEEAASYRVGEEYLLYLAPFEFQTGVSTGSYIAVGQLAAFRIDGDQALRITTRDGLPASATTADLLKDAATRLG